MNDEIKDSYADAARVLWASLRETDFHNGRNRIAALLRQENARLQGELAALIASTGEHITVRSELRAQLDAAIKERDEARGTRDAAMVVQRVAMEKMDAAQARAESLEKSLRNLMRDVGIAEIQDAEGNKLYPEKQP